MCIRDRSDVECGTKVFRRDVLERLDLKEPRFSIEPELVAKVASIGVRAVSYTHLRAHETVLDLVCRLLLEKKKKYTHTTVN